MTKKAWKISRMTQKSAKMFKASVKGHLISTDIAHNI